VLGGISTSVIEDNTQPWSGDHCIDFTKVPGVVLSNRKIRAERPALTDIAPTILAEFGIAKPDTMKGSNIFDASGHIAESAAVAALDRGRKPH
jgi:bisphosphoglycerate-independent phosphoglycerate mutase (AlkP superfamily)